MDTVITGTTSLLAAAIVVALVARRLKLPYTVGLVFAGMALALLHLQTGIVLSQGLIFTVILPPLLFEAAINISWPDLERDAVPIVILALPGTLIAAAAITTGMFLVLHWPISSAALFGSLIAATDPVAVIAMFKDNKVTGRLRLLVECESLFNDGVAAVLFALVLAGVQAAGGPNIGLASLELVGGGIAIGVVCAGAAILLAGRTTDHLIEATLTTVTAYGSFLLATHFGASGVLATVSAGLVMGNIGILGVGDRSRLALKGRAFVLDLWDFIAFIANSLIFLLIGITIGGLSRPAFGAGALIVILVLVLLSRALTVYPLCAILHRSAWKIPFHTQHVLWWGGLRGALGLALALSLPATILLRREILFATFGVVAFSVVVQGLTMPWLLRRKVKLL
jgi:CPA1 family monovalent cation:H+ antiporter